MNKNRSGYRLLSKLYFRLLPVQILLLLISSVNDIISSLSASNFIGGEAMSAIGLYTPIGAFCYGVGMMFVGGSQILCGKYMGENEIEKTRKVFSADLLLTAVFSAVMTAVCLIGSLGDLTRILTPDPVVRESLNRYLLGKAAGIMPLMLGLQISSFLSLENQTKNATAASVALLVSNFGLSYLFVGVLGMGEFGLALAPSVSLWIFLLIEMQHYFSGKSMMKLSPAGIGFREIWQIVKTGFPGSVGDGYIVILSFIVNALIVRFIGSVGLSAYAATTSVMDILWTIPCGMQAVSRMLMSVSIGEEDRKSLTDVMRIGLFKCFPLVVCVTAAVIALAVPLTRMFYRDPADPVFEMTVTAFRILPLYLPLSVVTLQFACYAQAFGKQFLVHLLSLIDELLGVAVFSFLLIGPMGISGLCIAPALSGAVCVLAIVLYSWISRKAFPQNVEQLMVIPDDFGVPEDARIDISVRNIDEVMNVSKQVIDFCRRRGIDGRTAFFSGLCLEEMAANVVQHGFHKDNKKSHSVDIRVTHKRDDVILRIKDDCIPFDPAERQEIFDPKDRAKGAGIRVVYKSAKDIRHQNILGMNVLIIRM